MPERVNLYSVTPPLEIEAIARLAVGQPDIVDGGSGVFFVVWPDVRVVLLPPMPEERAVQHLEQMMGYVVHFNGGEVTEDLHPILGFFQDAETVTGYVVEPDYDEEGKAKSLLVSIACSSRPSLMLSNDILYSAFGEVIMGPEEAEAFADLEQLTVYTTEVPMPKQTPEQEARTERVNTLLSQKGTPILGTPLRWIPDQQEVQLREPAEAARRLIAMHGVVTSARGKAPEVVLAELSRAGLGDALSPEEVHFLKAEERDEDQAEGLIWRLEGLLLLLWALGLEDELPWPGQMCDVEGVHQQIVSLAKEPERFIKESRLREVSSILDAAELTTRLHWAIRQSVVDQRPIPANLDWNSPTEMVSAYDCPLVGVVAERHYALNWLIRFDDADWDDVDTPT